MAPHSARGKQREDAAALCLKLKQIQGEHMPITAVQEVAITPRTPAAAMTPRPVVRGPQIKPPCLGTTLEEDEEVRLERVFAKFDKTGTYEVDMIDFTPLCEGLELQLDNEIAQRWLNDRDKGKGLTLEDFKELYKEILEAQNPGVRQVAGRKPLRLKELRGAELHLRTVFNKYAKNEFMTVDQLCEALALQGFPDVHGDKFDRFVAEWNALHGTGEDRVNFHGLVSCVNLLVDFCERHIQEESAKPTPAPTPRGN